MLPGPTGRLLVCRLGPVFCSPMPCRPAVGAGGLRGSASHYLPVPSSPFPKMLGGSLTVLWATLHAVVHRRLAQGLCSVSGAARPRRECPCGLVTVKKSKDGCAGWGGGDCRSCRVGSASGKSVGRIARGRIRQPWRWVEHLGLRAGGEGPGGSCLGAGSS